MADLSETFCHVERALPLSVRASRPAPTSSSLSCQSGGQWTHPPCSRECSCSRRQPLTNLHALSKMRPVVVRPILRSNSGTATEIFCYHYRLYVPEFASSLSISVANCLSVEGADCSLVLRIGSNSLRRGPHTVNCSGSGCSAALLDPPWDAWLRVEVESSRDNQTASFSIVSNYTGEHRNMKQSQFM